MHERNDMKQVQSVRSFWQYRLLEILCRNFECRVYVAISRQILLCMEFEKLALLLLEHVWILLEGA